MAVNLIDSQSGGIGAAGTLSLTSNIPNDILPNCVLVITYAETADSITSVQVLNGGTSSLSPVLLHPSGQIAQTCDFGEVRAYFTSISAGSSNQFTAPSQINVTNNAGALSATAVWLSAGTAGYVSNSTNYDFIFGPILGPWSLNDQSRGNGGSLRIASLLTSRNGTYDSSGNELTGPEDFWVDITTSVHLQELFGTLAVNFRAVTIAEKTPNIGNTSISFGGPGPGVTTPGIVVFCVSDVWPRNMIVRRRPFTIGRLSAPTGFINSPFRP